MDLWQASRERFLRVGSGTDAAIAERDEAVKKRGKEKRVRRDWKVKLPKDGLPDWVALRWARRVVRFLAKRAEKGGVPQKDLLAVLRFSRQGWGKFRECGKAGPYLTSIFRACHALFERDTMLVITREGPRIERCA